MQAVILAAGRGTRMNELTESTPKPMLRVAGKTLLEHKFDILPPDTEELILIVGYQADVIRSAYGDLYRNIPIRYIHQEALDGTMGALALAKRFLTDRFLVMMGDDIYAAEDLDAMRAVADWAMLVEKTDAMASGGRVVTDEVGEVLAIEEGDHVGSGLMNTNLFLLDPRIFDHPMLPKAPGSNEYGLPQTVLAAAREGNIQLQAVPTIGWLQVTTPGDLKRAEDLL